MGLERLAAGLLAAAAPPLDGVLWLPLSEDSWMEFGVGRAEDGARADPFCCLSWRRARSEIRVNVLTVESLLGVEQFRNALKHL